MEFKGDVSNFITGMKQLFNKNPEKAFALTLKRLQSVEPKYKIQSQVLKKVLGKQKLKYSDFSELEGLEQDSFAINMTSEKFYSSQAWLSLRYKFLKTNKKICIICKARGDQNIYHVDHIKPRSVYPELALKKNNLRILCDKCNLGKSDIIEKAINSTIVNGKINY